MLLLAFSGLMRMTGGIRIDGYDACFNSNSSFIVQNRGPPCPYIRAFINFVYK